MLAGFPLWVGIAGPFIVLVAAAIPYGAFYWLFRKDDPRGEEYDGEEDAPRD